MNILRLCPLYFPYFNYGGSVIADFELDKALVLEGHKVRVVTCKKRNDKLGTKEVSNGHSIEYFNTLGNVIYAFSIPALFRLRTILKTDRDSTDVIWFGGVWNLLTVLGPVLCRRYGVKYIITPHGMIISRLIDLKSSTLKRLVIRTILKRNLEKAYKVHFTVSNEFIETRKATGASMTPTIFPLCFDLKKFDGCRPPSLEHSKNGKLVLSFIGRITPKKRIDVVFAAINRLSAELKQQVEFQVVGTDHEKLWKENEYTEENIGVPISYKGPLFDQELLEAYERTDIFILCSESENFAISVVEAAYCYCVPLITKDVGVSEYFHDDSAVYAKLSVLDIHDKLSYLIRNPTLLPKYKLAARQVSEQFDATLLPDNYFLERLS